MEVAVDADIVTALREAYRPENYAGWAQRPGVDFITRDALITVTEYALTRLGAPA